MTSLPLASPPPGSPEVTVTSTVAANQATVWERVTTEAGINHELGPWMRMTVPEGAMPDIASAVIGERMFRSKVLLFGLIPFEYDDLTLIHVDDGNEFLERSPMLSAKVWEHHRILKPVDGGCEITDTVRFVPRIKPGAALHRRIVLAIFRHRHRRLQNWFSGTARPSRSE